MLLMYIKYTNVLVQLKVSFIDKWLVEICDVASRFWPISVRRRVSKQMAAEKTEAWVLSINL